VTQTQGLFLVGDIVSRGTEDAQMLAWAYENVTLDGKYQMVLGNHDDTFIEPFGLLLFCESGLFYYSSYTSS